MIYCQLYSNKIISVSYTNTLTDLYIYCDLRCPTYKLNI